MKDGLVSLNRGKKNYLAGFCVLRGTLSSIIKDLFLLHEDELNYFHTLKYDRRRLSYLLGRISAKKAISMLVKDQGLYSIFIDFGIFLFPVVKHCKDQQLQVSISHCDNIGITMAFPEDHPLGIDIEKIDPAKVNAVKSQVTEYETALIEKLGVPLAAGLTMVWTIKEGLSKIFRTGLMIDFSLLEIQSLEKTGNLYKAVFKNFGQYQSVSCISNDFVCSVIFPKNTVAGLEAFWLAFEELTA